MNDFTDLSGQTQLVFKDTTIRATYDEKGTPVFCAKDVATVLGYADTVNAIKQHCRGVAFHHPIVDILGRTQKARFIGEGLTSDEQLGAAVGKTSSAIRNYRLGKTVPNIETLMRLKEITHRPLDTMIIRSDALAA